MRIRRNKAKEAIMFANQSAILVENPHDKKGFWKQKSQQKVHLEIGGGKGDFWLGLKQQYPADIVIMVERNSTIAALAYEKAYQLKTTDNLYLINDDAKNIADWFMEGEIDTIYLNFSDPWHKKAHHKRRLTSSVMASKYYQLLSDKGRLCMKTDNQQLFEYSLIYLNEAHFQLADISLDLHKNRIVENVTEYERKFIERGQPIYFGEWKK